MVSIVRLIMRLFEGNEVKVVRMPPLTVIRANLLGLTFALGFTLITMYTGIKTTGTSMPLLMTLIVLAVFLVGTYFGGPFVFITALIFFFTDYGRLEADFLPALFYLARWYFVGYLFGALFATLYNDLVFLYLLAFQREKLKISFMYRKDNPVNIIKSPIPNQENTPRKFIPDPADQSPITETERTWGRRKLYDFNLNQSPDHPFTILFVANPYFCRHMNNFVPNAGNAVADQQQFNDELAQFRNNDANYIPDPILQDRDLFYSMVDQALLSLESDDVVGQKNIWSRVRVITAFADNVQNHSAHELALVEASQDAYTIGNDEIENLSVPLILLQTTQDQQDQQDTYRNYYNRIIAGSGIPYNEIDVIYALTAVPEYDRSSAAFSDGGLTAAEIDQYQSTSSNNANTTTTSSNSGEISGIEYSLDQGFGQMESNENQTAENVEDRYVHEYYSRLNGKIALNIIGSRKKSFIHEFAHAMSSWKNGPIVDEYYDQRLILGGPEPVPNAINRRLRTRGAYGVNPVPTHFRSMNRTEYLSDLDHPSAREDWDGFFPERVSPQYGCTMDMTIGRYRFDKLLSRFISDRIMAKMQR